MSWLRHWTADYARVFRPSSCFWVALLISLLIPLVPLCRMDIIIVFVCLLCTQWGSTSKYVFVKHFAQETAKNHSPSIGHSHQHWFPPTLASSLSAIWWHFASCQIRGWFLGWLVWAAEWIHEQGAFCSGSTQVAQETEPCVRHHSATEKDAVETTKVAVGSGDASNGLHFTYHGTKNIPKLPASLIYSHSHIMALFRGWRPEIWSSSCSLLPFGSSMDSSTIACFPECSHRTCHIS